MNISLIFVIIGIFGIFAMSFAFPILAMFMSFLGRSNNHTHPALNSDAIPSLVVAIPAHNEASNIARTIQSIQDSYKLVGTSLLNLKVIVGADGCSDETSSIAERNGAAVVVQPEKMGKWQTLLKLFKLSQNYFNPDNLTWIAFVDAGALWPKELLVKILVQLRQESIAGISPRYVNPGANIFERFSWLLESTLKNLENLAGGPVSVHGATVFYKYHALEKALEHLKLQSWTNDDVVIPMLIRCQNKCAKIVYRSDVQVVDGSDFKIENESARRRRLMQGNLQWIFSLWPKIILQNPVIACLALRRVSRILWAYWLVTIVAAVIVFLLAPFIKNIMACLGILALSLIVMLVIAKRSASFYAIFSASLFSPLYFLSLSRRESVWK